jgi:hypothetical protein
VIEPQIAAVHSGRADLNPRPHAPDLPKTSN